MKKFISPTLHLFFLFVLLLSFESTAQEGWMSFPEKQKKDTTLNFNCSKKGVVKVFKDSRIEEVSEFVGRNRESMTGTLIDGYRLQIFFDPSKSIAEQQKASFMNLYAQHKAYMDYIAPNYRVRVGNFRTKIEAEKLKEEIIGIYPTSIVIKDKIELPELQF